MLEQLTERERQILQLAAKGLTNDQIAATLSLSCFTVKGHLLRTFDKLGTHCRTEAVAVALRQGLITLPEDDCMQLGRRIHGIELPQKYKLLEDFVLEMVKRLEQAEAKYGDWREINKASIRAHLIDEFWELRASNFDSAQESVDLANLCAMNWALVNKYIIPKG
jgi:DNA-binding CsgD family transcriptional regulator